MRTNNRYCSQFPATRVLPSFSSHAIFLPHPSPLSCYEHQEGTATTHRAKFYDALQVWAFRVGRSCCMRASMARQRLGCSVAVLQFLSRAATHATLPRGTSTNAAHAYYTPCSLLPACRRGRGLGIDFFHCMNCNACMSLSLFNSHACREKALEGDCPVCSEYLFDSAQPIKVSKTRPIISTFQVYLYPFQVHL